MHKEIEEYCVVRNKVYRRLELAEDDDEAIGVVVHGDCGEYRKR